jgi:putative methionine-R-sulfoxide reductase with GAF domain
MHTILERLRSLGSSSTERATKAREAAELVRAARDYHWVGFYDVTPTEIAAIAWTGANAPAFPRFPSRHCVFKGDGHIRNDTENQFTPP